MKMYKGQYRVIKRGRKWIQVLSVPQNWKAELLLDDSTQNLSENDVINGVFEVLKDFPRQIRLLPNVSDQDMEDKKNLNEFKRWLDYCEDAIKKGQAYPNGIQKAEFFLKQLKTVDKEPLQKKLDEVKTKMKAIQMERERQYDLDKYKQYVGYVKNHEGYYEKGFAVLDEIIKKWGLEEYRQEVENLKREAIKRDIFLQIERARTIERIEQIIDKLNQEGEYNDALDSARKKKAQLIMSELERNFERFKQNYVYDLDLKQWLQRLPGIVSDVEDFISDEETQVISTLMDEFAKVYDAYVKLPKEDTNRMPESIREKLKELYRAKYEPSKSEWYVPIEHYNEAESILLKKFVSMDKIYEIAKDRVNKETALNSDEMFAMLPRHYNWLKRQYVMVIYPDGGRDYLGKRTNFSHSRKNATIEYFEADRQAIQEARFLQYRDGSYKHLTTYLYVQIDGKWYLLVATEGNLWDELLKRYVLNF